MALSTQWYFVQFRQYEIRPGVIGRQSIMVDFDDQITADNGRRSQEAECLGNYGVIKVLADTTTHQAITAAAGTVRIPLAHLNDTLDTLTLAQRQNLRSFLNTLGYTNAEIQAQFGAGTDLSGYTVGDVLRFALTRRNSARLDVNNNVVLNGPQIPTLPVEAIDAQV
jgi:hypothetical protein